MEVLGEEVADVRGVALELAVRGGSFLERPELAHPVVRLCEDAQPEGTDGDEQHRGAHERDEQLRVDPGGQATHGPDESIVARAHRPAPLGDGLPSPFR